MRALVIVMLAKLPELVPRILQRREPLHIQTLVSQTAIETLDESVLHRMAWPNKAQLHVIGNGPSLQRTTGKFTAIVHGNALRQTASLLPGTLQHLGHFLARHRTIRF
jgi:hypothetical protein